jgi:nucleoid-associated protein YgaU
MVHMAALLHPDNLSLFSPESEAAAFDAATSTAAAPWNDPAFLGSEPEVANVERPQLRLIVGGLHPSVAPAPSRRPVVRTLLGGLALAMLLALAAVGARNLLGADAAATVPASPAVINHPIGADATTTPSAPVEVVVQSGDTLWSIARQLRPSGEIRGVVDALQRRVGGTALEAGQRIDVHDLVAG